MLSIVSLHYKPDRHDIHTDRGNKVVNSTCIDSFCNNSMATFSRKKLLIYCGLGFFFYLLFAAIAIKRDIGERIEDHSHSKQNYNTNCYKQGNNTYTELSSTIKPVQVSFKSTPKLVHLDLKGAPPKMSYLLSLIPVFKKLGATGLLIEYEDMFPFHGVLRGISSQNSYSYKNIESLLQKAAEFGLPVIPLVQSLGHFEFVLKHKQFMNLRESAEYANMLCPLHNNSLWIVKTMIDQVLRKHLNITHIHIGGDETFNLQDCKKCKKSGKSKAELYQYHMLAVLKYVNEKTSGKVRPIIWDDMLRKWSVKEMVSLSDWTDIMVWGYGPDLSKSFSDDMWQKYQRAFKSIWVASSFKGAISANNNLVPLTLHMENHESWIQLATSLGIKFKGIAITGWSRYDHFATLCELLPAALPSLGICLSILGEGSLTPTRLRRVEKTLDFQGQIVFQKPLFGSWDVTAPNYSGGDVYALVAELENFISWYESNRQRFNSWISNRHIKSNLVSPSQVYGVQESLKQLIPSFKSFSEKARIVLSNYYFDDTIAEWVEDKITYYITLSEELQNRLNNITYNAKIGL